MWNAEARRRMGWNLWGLDGNMIKHVCVCLVFGTPTSGYFTLIRLILATFSFQFDQFDWRQQMKIIHHPPRPFLQGTWYAYGQSFHPKDRFFHFWVVGFFCSLVSRRPEQRNHLRYTDMHFKGVWFVCWLNSSIRILSRFFAVYPHLVPFESYFIQQHTTICWHANIFVYDKDNGWNSPSSRRHQVRVVGSDVVG